MVAFLFLLESTLRFVFVIRVKVMVRRPAA